MTAFEKLTNSIENKKSNLCVGLDTDISKLPDTFSKELDSILKFNKIIIDATKEFASAYKINFAFYEEYGAKGYEILKKTFEAIPSDIYTIADAKRGDIGNTSLSYAKAVFEDINADSITVSPYMGEDSVTPFLNYKDKMVFSLCLTSNSGSKDFQYLKIDNEELYKHVFRTVGKWADSTQLGFVVGATHPSELQELREMGEERFFLIPGIGAQGGDLEATIKANAGNKKLNRCLINSSRAIIYAGNGTDFAEKVHIAAKNTMTDINKYL